MMDCMQAFAMGEANRGQPQKVFDWLKAAQYIVDHKTEYAQAGLIEDFAWTGGPIWKDGKPVPRDDTYTYLASTWATPVLLADDKEIECWIWEFDTEWSEDTYWPPEALAVIGEGE